MARFPAGFSAPDMTLPLTLEATLARTPEGLVSKGMFLQPIVERCAANGTPVPFGPFIVFKDYPLHDHVRLLFAAGAALFPTEPVRERMRLLGLASYDHLESTFLGKVVFGVLGKDIRAITKRTPKAYEIAGRGVTATVLDHGDTHSHIALEGSVGLGTSYHYGAFQGVLRFCNVEGEVRCREVSDHRVEMFTIWELP